MMPMPMQMDTTDAIEFLKCKSIQIGQRNQRERDKQQQQQQQDCPAKAVTDN